MAARSALLRRPTPGARPARRASSVVAALAALAPRLVRLAHHDYPDGLLMARGVRVGTVTVGGGAPLALIAGPCVIESRDAALRHAERVREIAARAGLPVVYKSSFDKANRTSLDGFRGVGMEEGLAILAEARRATGLPVLTDVHEKEQVAAVAAVVDVLQTPAFLCRQTDFIVAVAAPGEPGDLQKGQVLSPRPIERAGGKARSTGNQDL